MIFSQIQKRREHYRLYDYNVYFMCLKVIITFQQFIYDYDYYNDNNNNTFCY